MTPEPKSSRSAGPDVSFGQSNTFQGPVAGQDQENYDQRHSKGTIIEPKGPVSQVFNQFPEFKLPRWVGWLTLVLVVVVIISLMTYIGSVVSGLPVTPPATLQPLDTTSQSAPSPAADYVATSSALKILWGKNWQQIKNRFQGTYCCPDGKTITNREKYLVSLDGLDLASDAEMQSDLERLVVQIEEAGSYPDPNWNMVLTPDIETALDKLANRIRNKAIENGVEMSE